MTVHHLIFIPLWEWTWCNRASLYMRQELIAPIYTRACISSDLTKYTHKFQSCLTYGLSTWDLGSGSDADRGSGFKGHFVSTWPRSDPSCVLCCVTVSEIKSSSAMRVVCVPCGAHARPYWIRIGDPDPVNPFSEPVWRAPSDMQWHHVHFKMG